MTEAPNDEDTLRGVQRHVQRLLGRCLLRIQQYERLLKAVLARHVLPGPVDMLQQQLAERADKLADKSLGTLVQALFETYVVSDGFERELLQDGKTPTDSISMAFSFHISMTPEDRSKTKAEVEDFVDLRNQLIHYFIDRFDVWTEKGCVDAVRYLEESYDRIDRHVLELTEWAKRMDEARGMAAQFTQTPMFFDTLVNGIAPDGSFEWSQAGIVRVLREATRLLAGGEWTRLDEARTWIGETHPEQTPEKYGCRTWPQVLSESRQFDLRYQTENGSPKVAWFRECG